MVARMRNHYRETHLKALQILGNDLPDGSIVRGGWTQLVGTAYERRVYAFRFETTPEQDDALIARLNAGPNRTRFNLLFDNCADFAREILNGYFPRTFRRSVFPDAGITTPEQTAGKLARYARKHPETHLTVFEILQVPGYRRASHANKSIAQSLTTTGYAVPMVLVNPYLAGGLYVDYLAHGRSHLGRWNPQILGPENLAALTAPAPVPQNSASAAAQAPGAAVKGSAESSLPATANPGLKEIEAKHE
jgi:hypothetical protein